jgi:DNA polymerase-4
LTVTEPDPAILHADLDAFYASVEQLADPSLVGKPVIVGGLGARGVVAAASYEARRFGVRSAMPMARARRACPQGVFLSPRFDAYQAASTLVMEIFRSYTPLVEPLALDEAFLDVRGARRRVGTGAAVAHELRARVRADTGLTVSVGVASTKFVAKLASDLSKPDGLLVVAPGTELDFLHPLPVERLWGVGPKTAKRLHDRGITTVADVARLDRATLTAMLGRSTGNHLHALAHNRDPRHVETGKRRGSIGSQHALGRHRPHTQPEIEAALLGIVDRVTRRMRAAHRVGRTVVLRLRFGDYTRATRSHTLAHPTAHTWPILQTARALLDDAMPTIRQRGITLVGLAVANLDDDRALQLALPLDRHTPQLDTATDAVHERFGTGALTRAALVTRRGRGPSRGADPAGTRGPRGPA